MITVISVRANEHRDFLAVAVILTAIVIWAFSFEYQDLIHPIRFSLLVLAHGLVMFTWVGLFLTQVAFVVWHRPLWHRRLR